VRVRVRVGFREGDVDVAARVPGRELRSERLACGRIHPAHLLPRSHHRHERAGHVLVASAHRREKRAHDVALARARLFIIAHDAGAFFLARLAQRLHIALSKVRHAPRQGRHRLLPRVRGGWERALL
jgi:hypothetical protein